MNLKQKLSQKMKKTGGFTLIEMLIVVAIIAILIAVSIPLVSSSLEKAGESTDAANERAAKAAALSQYMLDRKTGTVTYIYDAAKGKVVTDTGTPEGGAYGQCSNHKQGHVQVEINGTTGEATVKWYKDTTAMTDGGENLDSEKLIAETTKPES